MSWKRIYLAESLRKSFFLRYMNPNARNLLLYVADEGLARLFLSESFLRRKCFFQCAGEANAGTQEQLKSFFHTLRRYDSLYANGYFFDMFFLFETLLSHRLDREGAIGLTCEKSWFFYCLWGVWGNVITHKKCVNSHFFGFWHIFFINGSACFQEEEEAQLNNFVQICVRYVKNLPYWVILFKFCYKTIKIIE